MEVPRKSTEQYTITDAMTSWDDISIYSSCHKISTCFGNSINWGVRRCRTPITEQNDRCGAHGMAWLIVGWKMPIPVGCAGS